MSCWGSRGWRIRDGRLTTGVHAHGFIERQIQCFSERYSEDCKVRSLMPKSIDDTKSAD